jgi:hypothetical protein
MGILVRAVITGFGLSVGAALYKRVAKQLGLDEKGASEQTRAGGAAEAADSGAAHPSPGGAFRH